MKTLKRWIRGWVDRIAIGFGYVRLDHYKVAVNAIDPWMNAYADAQRRYSFAQDRLNKLMRYKHVQAVAAMIDEGRGRL